MGHKMVDTFEKMDAINPTFDLGPGCGRVMKISEVYFPTLTIYLGGGHLFNNPITNLTECCWWVGVVMLEMLWTGSSFEHTQILTQLV